MFAHPSAAPCAEPHAHHVPCTIPLLQPAAAADTIHEMEPGPGATSGATGNMTTFYDTRRMADAY